MIKNIRVGGNAKSRNSHMQTMLRRLGFGHNNGSGFLRFLILGRWIEI